MSDRQKFMANIRQMWLNIGRSEISLNAVHDWNELFQLSGGKADAAVWAFEEALRCE